MRIRSGLIVGLMALTALSGCGSSKHPSRQQTPAARAPTVSLGMHVCSAAQQAAGRRLGMTLRVRVESSDPSYLECVLHRSGLSLDVIAQAIPQARAAYETAIVHLVQTYVEPQSLKFRAQLPQNLAGIGSEAAWVAVAQRLLATNETFHRGGNFLSVTVTRHGFRGPSSERIAEVIAPAALAVAPHGPNPGPPPA